MNTQNAPSLVEKKKIVPISEITYPTDDQGLIFNHIGETKIRDYLLAIYQLVGGAQNILAASRISGGKVIIFLYSKELVDTFQAEKGGFQLGDTFVTTKKLKPPATKLILSNVSPTIPNQLLEDTLTNTLQIKLISPISILRANPNDDIFGHVLCWRRQVYISSNIDRAKIPSSIHITHSNRTYRIFLSHDNFICFKCGSKGHKAEECTEELDEEAEGSIPNNMDIIEPSEIPAKLQNSNFSLLTTRSQTPSIPSFTTTIKETTLTDLENNAVPLSSTGNPSNKIKKDPINHSSEQLPSSLPSTTDSNVPYNNSAELTIIQTVPLEQIIDHIKPLYSDPVKYRPPITADAFAEYLESCKSPAKEAIINTKKLNVPIPEMIQMLSKAHTLIQNSKTKGRITRIITALSKKNNNCA
ncbi:hypothetical protein PGB90_010106 [Kerria lacca]